MSYTQASSNRPSSPDGAGAEDEESSMMSSSMENKEQPTTMEVKLASTPLPKSIYIICVILFSESFVASMLFPFVAFMVQDFGVAPSEDDVGYYSGFLASAFFLGQFISSAGWGYLSDRYGRRPILLIGMCGSATTAFLFGMSPSYTWAIIFRTVGGCLNSNFPVSRSYIGDITDSTNRVQGYSMVGLMWGAGSIFGPFLGGLLSKPSENMKWLHLSPDNFFNAHPYVGPCVVGASISVVAILITFFYLPESRRHAPTTDSNKKPEVELEQVTTDSSEEQLLEDAKQEEKEEGEFQLEESSPTTNNKRGFIKANLLNTIKQKILPKTARDYVKMRTDKNKKKQLDSFVEHNKKPGISIVFKSRAVLTTTVLICLQSFSVIALDDIFPLWAKEPIPKGLGFKSSQIGVAWSLGGISLLLFQAFAYTKIVSKITPLRSISIGGFGLAIVSVLYPCLVYIADTKLLWPGLGFTLMARYVTGSLTGTTLNVILNIAGGPEVQKHRGVVNGFAMSLRGFVVACAPFVISSMFAWSMSSGLSFPFNHFFVFIILSLNCFFVGLGALFIPKEDM